MNDLISRQAAIDEFDGLKVDDGWCTEYESGYNDGYNDGIDVAVSILSVLPSAEPRIIRCKDCKHRPVFINDEDGDRHVEGPRYPETLKNGHTFMFEDETCPCVNGLDSYFSYVPKDDWFCANGERRES